MKTTKNENKIVLMDRHRRRQPFQSGIMLSPEGNDIILQILKDNPVTTKTLFFLMFHMDRDNRIEMSIEDIAAGLGLKRRVVMKDIAYLRTANVISIEKDPFDRRRNIYTVNRGTARICGPNVHVSTPS